VSGSDYQHQQPPWDHRPDCRCLRCRHWHWVERSIQPRERRATRTGIGIFGGALLVIGGYAWLRTSAIAGECRSGLVTALDPQQCTSYTDIHTAAAVGALTGIVLIIIAVARANRGDQ
jgi:hypothetical protein